MVRQTHRRRQSRGRRRNTRRSRRTQRGGFSFSSFFGSSNIEDLEKKLAKETDPKKKAEIETEIRIAKEDKRHEEAVEMIKNGTAAAEVGAASRVSSNSALSTGSPYNSSASQASTGAGPMSSNDMVYTSTGANIGGRRRSRRYRRR